MAYDKQIWVSGEVITATKLNHMEDGIANSGGGGSADIFDFDSIVDQQTRTINGSDIEQLVSDKPLVVKTGLTNDYGAERYMFFVEYTPNSYGEGEHSLTYSAMGSTETYNNGFIMIGLHQQVDISYTPEPDAQQIDIDFVYDSATDKYVYSQPDVPDPIH